MNTCKKQTPSKFCYDTCCLLRQVTSFNHTASSDLVHTRLDLPANQTPEHTAMEICSAASGTTLAVLEDVEGQTTKAVKQRLAIDLGISRFRQRMLSTHMGIPFFVFWCRSVLGQITTTKLLILMQLQSFFHFIIILIFYFLGKATPRIFVEDGSREMEDPEIFSRQLRKIQLVKLDFWPPNEEQDRHLAVAVRDNDVTTLETLLRAPRDPNLTEVHETLLHRAAWHGHVEVGG